MPRGPKGLVIRSYNVGFGDCHLLSFHYSRSEKHVLIDFGTTAKPKGASSDHMQRVADDIATVTDGKLDALVVTHRHRDHISGFDGKTGKTIVALSPDVIIQPWTEDPSAATDARRAKNPVQRKNALMLQTLADMEMVAQNAQAMAQRARPRRASRWRELVDQLRFIGEENIRNKGAVTTLMNMVADRRYVRAGNSAGLGRILAGVKVHILGPPTLEQSSAIEKYAKGSEQEYWHLSGRAGDSAVAGKTPLARFATKRVPEYARWFKRRMRDAYAAEVLELVRELDDVLNNTSVILLFETQGHKFLFPGDAQLENCQHALDEYKNLLRDVDLYKVGHHGSLNATPKSLWDLFVNKSKRETSNRLATLMSTMSGKHGSEAASTEVPRRTLVEALEKESDVYDTRDLAKDEMCWEIEYEF